jgi:hypothetical protein
MPVTINGAGFARSTVKILPPIRFAKMLFAIPSAKPAIGYGLT